MSYILNTFTISRIPRGGLNAFEAVVVLFNITEPTESRVKSFATKCAKIASFISIFGIV